MEQEKLIECPEEIQYFLTNKSKQIIISKNNIYIYHNYSLMYFKQTLLPLFDKVYLDNDSNNLILISLKNQELQIFSLQKFQIIWYKKIPNMTHCEILKNFIVIKSDQIQLFYLQIQRFQNFRILQLAEYTSQIYKIEQILIKMKYINNSCLFFLTIPVFNEGLIQSSQLQFFSVEDYNKGCIKNHFIDHQKIIQKIDIDKYSHKGCFIDVDYHIYFFNYLTGNNITIIQPFKTLKITNAFIHQEYLIAKYKLFYGVVKIEDEKQELSEEILQDPLCQFKIMCFDKIYRIEKNKIYKIK